MRGEIGQNIEKRGTTAMAGVTQRGIILKKRGMPTLTRTGLTMTLINTKVIEDSKIINLTNCCCISEFC